MKIAVIGGGVAGLACAAELHRAGIYAEVFEKSRGLGGRMPTRWLSLPDLAQPRVGFDHGTQYFTAEHPAFIEAIERAHTAGHVAAWQGRVVDLSYGAISERRADGPRWVGVPGMTAFGHFLGEGLPIALQTRVESIARDDSGWNLSTISTSGAKRHTTAWDAVVVAAPAEQATTLLAPCDGFATLAAGIQSNPNWTVMAEFSDSIAVPYDGAFVHDSPLGWIARDSSKPGRGGREHWVLQATASWSATHLEHDPEQVAEQLMDVFFSLSGLHLSPQRVQAHRWRYSTPINPLERECLWDSTMCLGACGDWVKGARVESAFLSGWALGQTMAKDLLRSELRLD